MLVPRRKRQCAVRKNWGVDMKAEEIRLAQLAPNENAIVTAIESDDGLRLRLADLGLIEGTAVCCVLRASGGSPIAYAVRGGTIALRGTDAAKIRARYAQ